MDALTEILSPKKAENSKADAVSSAGATGVMQVMPGALADFNKDFGTQYTMEDMKNPKINEYVGDWYFNTKIPKYLKHYGVEPTDVNKLLAYNSGASLAAARIKNGYEGFKDESYNYIIKSYDKEFGVDATKGINVFSSKYREDAKKVQQHLQKLGYYTGKIDGIFGQKSKQALIQYMKEKK